MILVTICPEQLLPDQAMMTAVLFCSTTLLATRFIRPVVLPLKQNSTSTSARCVWRQVIVRRLFIILLHLFLFTLVYC